MIMYFKSLLPFDDLICSPSIPSVAADSFNFSTFCLHKSSSTLKKSSSALIIIVIIIIIFDCRLVKILMGQK